LHFDRHIDIALVSANLYLIKHRLNILERIKVRVRIRLLKDDYGERRL